MSMSDREMDPGADSPNVNSEPYVVAQEIQAPILTQNDSSAREQSISRLLQLPAELRNHVYEYALGGHTLDFASSGMKSRVTKLPKDTFALTRTCRQVYEETALLLYSANTFCFKCIKDIVIFSHTRTFVQLRAMVALQLSASAGRFLQRDARYTDNFSFLADFEGIKVVHVADSDYQHFQWNHRELERMYEEIAAKMRRWAPRVSIMVRDASENVSAAKKY